jgi:hypothetical protein
LHTLINGVARGIDEVIEKLEVKNIPRVGDREVFLKHAVEPFTITVFGRGFQLKKLLKGFKLDFKEVRIITCEPNLAEAKTILNACFLDCPVRDAVIGHFCNYMLEC